MAQKRKKCFGSENFHHLDTFFTYRNLLFLVTCFSTRVSTSCHHKCLMNRNSKIVFSEKLHFEFVFYGLCGCFDRNMKVILQTNQALLWIIEVLKAFVCLELRWKLFLNVGWNFVIFSKSFSAYQLDNSTWIFHSKFVRNFVVTQNIIKFLIIYFRLCRLQSKFTEK